MDHLSSIDASFLHLETPETPMHVGSLMLLDLPEGYPQEQFYEDIKAMIGQRMHLASVLTRKLAQTPFGLAEPVWIEDDDIDLDYHVRSIVLRQPGTMDQLQKVVARLHSSLLDRSRPLWEMYIIEGLDSGQMAFYAKAHHSGVDGKAGVELAKVLYDLSPKVRQVPPPRRRYRRRGGYQLGVAELLQAATQNAVTQYRKLAELAPVAARAYMAAGNVLQTQRTEPGQRRLMLGLAPHSIFNDSITNQRSFTAMSLPFDQIKEVGERAGGTVNTVVMAMCSGALRRFLKVRGELPDKSLIAGVPVSLRTEGNDSMNNQVSAVRVDLATDLDDPLERFEAIHASSEAAKAVVRELRPVLGADMPMTGTPWLLTSLAALYGRSSLPRSLPPMANVAISNVPGVPVPLYLCGARVRTYYPISIPYHGMGLNITVQSYAGQLEWGLTACRRIVSQAESQELQEYLRQALKEIESLPAVGAKVATGDKPSKTKAKTKTKTKAKGKSAARKKAGAAKSLEKGQS